MTTETIAEHYERTHQPVDTKTRPNPRPHQVMSVDELRVGKEYHFFTKATPDKPYTIKLIQMIENNSVRAKVVSAPFGVVGHEWEPSLYELGVTSDEIGFWMIDNYLAHISH